MKLIISAGIGAALAIAAIVLLRKAGCETEAMDFIGRVALGIVFMRMVDKSSERWYYANRR